MAIDYDQVRINNRADETPVRLSADESAWLRQRREDEAERQEREEHERERKDFAGYAVSKALDARRRGCDAYAKVWDEAVINIGKGVWTHAPSINADPAITRFQPLRTRLAYAGKMVRFAE